MYTRNDAIAEANAAARHYARMAEQARENGDIARAGKYADKAAACAKKARSLDKPFDERPHAQREREALGIKPLPTFSPLPDPAFAGYGRGRRLKGATAQETTTSRTISLTTR